MLLFVEGARHSESRKAEKSSMRPEGVIVPMFSPCMEDGQLDPAGIRGYVDYLESRSGIASIFVRSGVGRMYTFTCDETRLMMREAIHASQRTPILPGTAGEYDGNPDSKPSPEVYTSQTIELSKEAQALGAPAVVVILPSGLTLREDVPTEDLIFEYYRQIDQAVDIPILLYQPPGMPIEFQMTSSLMRRIAKLNNVAGMKLSSADETLWRELGQTAQETGFTMICGNESAFLMALFHGAQGVIGEGCNLYPELLCALKHYFDMGNLDEAEILQEKVKKALGLKSMYSSALVAKALARYRGFPVRVTLRPNTRYASAGYHGQDHPEPTIPDPSFITRYDEALRKACAPYMGIFEE